MNMILKVLTLRIHPTLIWAGYWVRPTHWPVFGCYIFEVSSIVTTVVTTEGSSDALFNLVGGDIATLEQVTAVQALNLSKLTTNELLV